jgi:hypothetical protein
MPNFVLSDDGAKSIQAPWALVFAHSGNLWSSNANTPFTLVEFATTQLVPPSSAPVPVVTISPTSDVVTPVPSLIAPNGIAFDSGGNLAAVSSAANGLGGFVVSGFLPGQLKVSGAPNPAFLINGSALSAPAGNTFGPIVP